MTFSVYIHHATHFVHNNSAKGKQKKEFSSRQYKHNERYRN